MKIVPPKVLAITRDEGDALLQRVLKGTATAEEKRAMMAIVENVQEVLAFIEADHKEWRDHVMEIDHGWRKRKNQNES